MKYSKQLARDIAETFATGEHKIVDVCTKHGISETTFHAWKAEKPEFSELLKKAEERRRDAFKQMALSGLASRLMVQEYEEVTTEYADNGGKPKIKSRKVTKKRVQPSDVLIMFTLKNTDSENFRDKHEVEHLGGFTVNWHEELTPDGPDEKTE